MANNKWLRCVLSVALSFLITASSLACLLTAFQIPAPVTTVLLWSLGSAVVFSVAYTKKWQFIPWAALMLAAGYLLQSGKLARSAGGLLFCLTSAYNLVHGWQIIGEKANPELVLSVLGVVLGLLTSRTICRRRSCFLPVVGAVLPVIPILLISESTLQPVWLGLWLGGIGLLLMSQPSRKQENGEKITAFIALPLAALSVALLLILPPSRQAGPQFFAEKVTSFLEELGIGSAPGKAMQVNGGAVELGKLGSRKESGEQVMTVTADTTGKMYLRGCAYDTYYRSNWTNLAVQDQLYWPDKEKLEYAGVAVIRTEPLMSMRYFPYYATDGSIDAVTRGINNYGGIKEYSYDYGVLDEYPQTYTTDQSDYTVLPTVTQRWAEGVVAQIITADMSDQQKIAAITDYVQSCARYSLNVEKMPKDERDFAIWFAEEADKGYCVHFATLGAVLLRAAGLPSRYVTGYVVQAKAGVQTPVYGKDAHAWVECFLDGVGWVPVEFTPGAATTETAWQQGEKQTLHPELLLYIGVGLLLLALLGLVLQWQVRVAIRRRKRRKGSDKERVLAYYRQLEELLAIQGKLPAKELTQLAERVKYSPHPVELQWLQLMEQSYKNARKRAKKQPLFKRLHHRLILGLY